MGGQTDPLPDPISIEAGWKIRARIRLAKYFPNVTVPESVHPQKSYLGTALIPRHLAKSGQMCNPWLDQSGYCPLELWCLVHADLNDGDRILFAELVYRKLQCGGRSTREQLTAETHSSRKKVNRRIRKLVALGLLHWHHGCLLPVDQKGEPYSSEKELEDFVRLPCSLMKAGIPESELVVYARLAKLAGPKGYWFGNNQQLGKVCSRSQKRVQEIVKALESRKLIVRHKQPRTSGRGGSWNFYHFLGHPLLQKSRKIAQ